MAMSRDYQASEPSRAEVDATEGPLVLEFGSPSCGFCLAAQPRIAAAFAGHDGVAHLKIADGRGRRLGRSFRVKLWPTLVFLRDGEEQARLVRPAETDEIRRVLEQIDQAR